MQVSDVFNKKLLFSAPIDSASPFWNWAPLLQTTALVIHISIVLLLYIWHIDRYLIKKYPKVLFQVNIVRIITDLNRTDFVIRGKHINSIYHKDS